MFIEEPITFNWLEHKKQWYIEPPQRRPTHSYGQFGQTDERKWERNVCSIYQRFNVVPPSSMSNVELLAREKMKKMIFTEKIWFKNVQLIQFEAWINIVIFIHSKPPIDIAILDLQWMKMCCTVWQTKNCQYYNSFLKMFVLNPLGVEN